MVNKIGICLFLLPALLLLCCRISYATTNFSPCEYIDICQSASGNPCGNGETAKCRSSMTPAQCAAVTCVPEFSGITGVAALIGAISIPFLVYAVKSKKIKFNLRKK